MDENNIYEDYCVAFIDILGFKEMTNSSEKIIKFGQILNDSIDIMKNFEFKEEVFSNFKKIENIINLQASDSLFFIFPKDFPNIYLVIRRLCILQFTLALKGIYTRGAISSGSMYIDKNNSVYFGEAWNKAVVTEKNAVYPRIILESSIAKLLEDKFKDMGESIIEFYLDEDGSYVLGSFGILPLLEIAQNVDYKDKNRDILEPLDSYIEEFYDNRAILLKYLWIAKQIEKRHYRDLQEHAARLVKRILDLLSNI